jgi:hypothetical protein
MNSEYDVCFEFGDFIIYDPNYDETDRFEVDPIQYYYNKIAI